MSNDVLPNVGPTCPDVLAIQRQHTEDLELVMRRLATQDEIIAKLSADYEQLRERVREFADSMVCASAYFEHQAELLRDFLR